MLAGPVDLVQGGQGFVGRFPVFVDDGRGDRRFWGIVSAVVDGERLYRDSGLLDDDLPIEMAIPAATAGRQGASTFFGDAIVRSDPVTAEVVLPSGSWHIAAVPKGGWDQTPPNAWISARYADRRRADPGPDLHDRAPDRREAEEYRDSPQRVAARQLSQRLELALDASHIGVWEHDPETDELFWDDRVNQLYG